MFSAAKARWLLDRLPSGQARAEAGELCIGTIDAFLLSRFGGEPVVEAGNASRTQVFDVVKARWDDELLSIFGIPVSAMPRVVSSTGPFPSARGLAPLPDGVPVGAVMADSHSALFAHGAFAPGPVKATHGTGSSVMGLLDRAATRDGEALGPGVCLTLAWQLAEPVLAFEGNIRSAGSTLIWAAELLGVDTQELARLAATAADSARRPSRAGLRRAGSAVVGRLGRRNRQRRHLRRDARATRPGGARFDRPPDRRRSRRVRASGAPVERLLVDGGPTRNDQLMQFEADMVAVPVERTDVAELSAMGVAHLAGVSAGVFTIDGLRRLDRGGQAFKPSLAPNDRAREREAWARAVARSRGLAIH